MRTAYDQPQPLSADTAARLDVLFRLYNRDVLALARRLARRPADADDLASTVWLAVATRLGRLRADDAHALPWLRSCVRTVAIDFYRPRRQGERPADWSDVVASASLPASESAEEASEVLVLSVLTPKQSVVIKLKAQGYSDLSIARRICRSETAVWKRKHAGARRLRSYAMAGC